MTDNIFSIKLPLPGKKPGPVNIYLFIGKDNITLLDAGASHTSRLLNNALAEHGLKFEDIDRIVLTHSHVDHFGIARKISRTPEYTIEISGNFERPVSIATGLNVPHETLTAFLQLSLIQNLRKELKRSNQRVTGSGLGNLSAESDTDRVFPGR